MFSFIKKLLPLLALSVGGVEAEQTSVWDNWHLSGYAKLVGSAVNHRPASLDMDDLSLFVSANIKPWLNPFMEAEAYAIPFWEDGKGAQFNSTQLVFERLYNDIEITDSDTLRFGKFLAPINHWNIVHAAPLVWTVNRPLTTTYSMANYVTGLSAKHEFDAFSGYALEIYWQPGDEFNSKTLENQPLRYSSIVGGRWILHQDLDYYYAVAAQHADVKNRDETRTTFSADANWTHQDFELEAGLAVTLVDTRQPQFHDKDWGGFLQGAVPLVEHIYATGRYEHYEFSNQAKATDTALAGLVFRPQTQYSFKLEWQQSWGDISHNPTGLYGSIAVLF